jgi:8-oxo-dGTP pyrophosphatase MutT (NUDIX family)
MKNRMLTKKLKQRFKITPASYLVLIKHGKILLSRRYNTGYRDGQYTLVSGHVDEGESFISTMVREAREEANIKIRQQDLEVVHVMNRCEGFDPIGIRHRIDVYLAPKQWQGEIKNLEPHKCDDLAWFPLAHLPKNTIPFVRAAIKDIRIKKHYSEFGF